MTHDNRGKKTWHLDAVVDEHENRTRAKVRLSWHDTKLVGVGLARLDPADEPVAAIGDELALARALSDLAYQLFELTVTDIETATHKPATKVRL
jgi:Rv2632c-like